MIKGNSSFSKSYFVGLMVVLFVLVWNSPMLVSEGEEQKQGRDLIWQVLEADERFVPFLDAGCLIMHALTLRHGVELRRVVEFKTGFGFFVEEGHHPFVPVGFAVAMYLAFDCGHRDRLTLHFSDVSDRRWECIEGRQPFWRLTRVDLLSAQEWREMEQIRKQWEAE